MPKNPNLSDVGNILTSATTINENNAAIEASFQNTLSRDGSTPNQMNADLDLNSNDLLNVNSISTTTLTLGGELVIPSTLEYGLTWQGEWQVATAYGVYDLIKNLGNVYLCLVNHTSSNFSTELAAGNWVLWVTSGETGPGSGDLVSANNLSDVASASIALSNLGGQPLDTTLTNISGVSVSAAEFGWLTGVTSGIQGQIDAIPAVIDEDDFSTNSATRPPSQQSTKAYVDGKTWTDWVTVTTVADAAKDITSLPAGITDIQIALRDVSINGTSQLLLQIGSGGSPDVSGYAGGFTIGATTVGFSSGFNIFNNSAAQELNGTIDLSHIGGNDWVAGLRIGYASNAGVGAGGVTLSGALDMFRLTTLVGSQDFDNGKFAYRYR